jgi:hypothetical protein
MKRRQIMGAAWQPFRGFERPRGAAFRHHPRSDNGLDSRIRTDHANLYGDELS